MVWPEQIVVETLRKQKKNSMYVRQSKGSGCPELYIPLSSLLLRQKPELQPPGVGGYQAHDL